MRGKRRVLTMPDELWDRLKAEADRKGLSASEYARRLLDNSLTTRGDYIGMNGAVNYRGEKVVIE